MLGITRDMMISVYLAVVELISNGQLGVESATGDDLEHHQLLVAGCRAAGQQTLWTNNNVGLES